MKTHFAYAEESACSYQGKDISTDAEAIVNAVESLSSWWEAAELANKPSKQEKALLKSMFNAFCQLKAVEWLVSLTSDNG